MKIQISLLRGLMASSLLWNLPEVFCVYMHIHSLLLPHTLLLVPDYIYDISFFSSYMVFPV